MRKFNKPGYTDNINLNKEDYQNLFIVGTALEGPINEPIRVRSMDEVEQFFGVFGSLHRAYSIIQKAFPDDYRNLNIYMVKIGGEYAYCNINESLSIRTTTTSPDLQDAFVEVINENIIFKYPNMNIERVYKIRGNDLIDKINSDIENPAMVYEQFDEKIGLQDGVYAFSTPSQRINLKKNEMYINLKQTFELLEGLQIANIVVMDAYVDDHHPGFNQPVLNFETFEDEEEEIALSNSKDFLDLKEGGEKAAFHNLLSLFCKKQLNVGISTHGVIGISPYGSEAFRTLLEANDTDGIIKESDKKDGLFISVTAGDIVMGDGYTDNFYLVYATILTLIPPHESATNYKLPETIHYQDNFDTDGINLFKDNGITTYRYSVLNDFVVHNSVTLTDAKSKFYYLDHIKTAGYVIYRLNKRLKTHVGQAVEVLLESNDLIKEIEAELSSLKNNSIEDYSFSFTVLQSALRINLTLTTIKTLQEIKVGTGVNF